MKFHTPFHKECIVTLKVILTLGRKTLITFNFLKLTFLPNICVQ